MATAHRQRRRVDLDAPALVFVLHEESLAVNALLQRPHRNRRIRLLLVAVGIRGFGFSPAAAVK